MMNSAKKDLTAGFSVLNTVYWVGFAATGAFSSSFLLHAGLTNSEIGRLLDAAGVHTLLAVTTVLSAIGACVMIFAVEKTEKVAGQ